MLLPNQPSQEIVKTEPSSPSSIIGGECTGLWSCPRDMTLFDDRSCTRSLEMNMKVTTLEYDNPAYKQRRAFRNYWVALSGFRQQWSSPDQNAEVGWRSKWSPCPMIRQGPCLFCERSYLLRQSVQKRDVVKGRDLLEDGSQCSQKARSNKSTKSIAVASNTIFHFQSGGNEIESILEL